MKIAKYKLKITLTEDMLGTVPMSKSIYNSYVAEKLRRNLKREGLTQEEAESRIEEELCSIPGQECEDGTVKLDGLDVKGLTGFHSDDKGLYVYDYFVKGFLKSAAKTLKAIAGVKQLRSKTVQHVFIHPRKIYLGQKEHDPESINSRPLRAETAQGPRVSIARSFTIPAGRSFECEIHVIGDLPHTEKILTDLLDYGKYMGLGCWRSGGYGSFEYELSEME